MKNDRQEEDEGSDRDNGHVDRHTGSGFCELVWTMRRLYKRRPDEVADAVEAILRVATVVTDRLAVEAGLVSWVLAP